LNDDDEAWARGVDLRHGREAWPGGLVRTTGQNACSRRTLKEISQTSRCPNFAPTDAHREFEGDALTSHPTRWYGAALRHWLSTTISSTPIRLADIIYRYLGEVLLCFQLGLLRSRTWEYCRNESTCFVIYRRTLRQPSPQ
jgi:hypothetical protein